MPTFFCALPGVLDAGGVTVMRRSPNIQFRPALESLEKILPLRASPVSAAVVTPPVPANGFTLFRITNPAPNTSLLIPPFQQVLVQSTMPQPGKLYNVLSVSVRNGTARTFDASSGFAVRVTGQTQSFPILTGNQRWKPGQVFVFYVLTKKYYPLRPITGAGFEFNLGGSNGTAVPGPSGIFLRVKYNPTTFPRLLNWIVAHGPGSKGHQLGLPDTAIWEFVSAKTNIIPL
jgi:hypothetical protein